MARGTEKAAKIALAAAAIMAIAWAATYFYGVTPVQKIDRVLENVRAAAQARNVQGIAAELTTDYRDSTGLDRSGMAAHAQEFFLTVDSLKISYESTLHEDPKLPMSAISARAIVVVRVTGEQKIDRSKFSGLAGAGADAFHVRFKKEDGSWKIASSKLLKATTPEGLLKEAGWAK